MRVSMSAMGSGIVTDAPPSPGCLRDTGDLAGMGELPEADTTQPEAAIHGSRTATTPATRVGADRELRAALLLLDQCLLRHENPSESFSRRDGTGSRVPGGAHGRGRRCGPRCRS